MTIVFCDDLDPFRSMDAQKDQLDRIGAELKSLRLGKGYKSHVGFANDNGLDQKYYFEVEKGKRNPSIGYLKKVLEAHSMTLAQFFNTLEM